MSTIDIVVSLLRGVHVASLVSLFGTLLFMAAVLPDGKLLRRTLRHLVRTSNVAGLIAGIAWLVLQTATIADADNVALTLRALPTVALHTQFGQWLSLRLVLLVAVLLLHRTGMIIPIVLAGAALVLQPLLGHAGAVGGGAGAELIASEALHLLAAGAWLGGLLPLFLSVRRLPHDAAAAACRGFTPIGLASVLLLAGTAVVQVASLMGGLPGLFGTGYGHVALVKLGLFLVLLTLAALNRLALTDRLAASSGMRLAMQLSIAAEMALGASVVITAGFLASLTPGTHEQPVWPFAWRLSAWAFSDPGFRTEVTFASIAMIAGIAVIVAGLAWRRIRWFALAGGVVIAVAAIPHLDLLFVAAYPTSFFSSPTEFAATAIVHGEHVFAANCVTCHGTEGRGDGPAAKSLPLPPADLTAAHFLAHSDGELYWYISHGFPTDNGATAMPGFAKILSSEAIWDVIDYLHAHNGGYALRHTGGWPQPLPVPQFDLQCPNGQMMDLEDLRGRGLRIIAASGDEQPEASLPADLNVATVLVLRNVASKRADGPCIASEPQVWMALAVIVGVSPDALAGTELLADQNGWLRAAWHPGDADNWNDPRVLAARMSDILAHPLTIVPSSGHVHSH